MGQPGDCKFYSIQSEQNKGWVSWQTFFNYDDSWVCQNVQCLLQIPAQFL